MCSVMQADSRKTDMLKILHKATERLECNHCNFKGSDYENVQIHMGTIHPEFCDEMDTAGLGKLIFYQKSAKLFHCHKCFFTSKMYCNVYHHITAHHALSDKWNEDHKGVSETESLKKPLTVEPQKPLQSPEINKPGISPDAQKPSELLKSDVGLYSKIQKPTSITSMEHQKAAPVACLEAQKSVPIVPELSKTVPVESSEPLKPSLSVIPEPLKPSSEENPEISKTVSVLFSEKQKPAMPTYTESQKSLPVAHSELFLPVAESDKPAPHISPEPQKSVCPASPETQKSAQPASPPVVTSEVQKFASTLSPEPRRHSPAVSPEPRRHSPAVSPEPRRHSPAVSPEPRRYSPAVSPELKKSVAALSAEPRRHVSQIRRPTSALSPEPRKPDPPLSSDPWRPVPEPWRSAPTVSHEQQKSITVSPWSPKPPTSMSLEPRRPASEPRRPGTLSSEIPKFLPDTWKSTSTPESPKSSLASSEPWKPISSVYPEGWKPVLSPDTWRPSPSVPPPAPPAPAELRKPAPPVSSDIWKQPFFSEQRKPTPSVSPDPWKFSPESRKSFFSETQKPTPFVSSELQKRALFSELRKRALFPEPKKCVPPVSVDSQKRSFFHEAHIPFPEVPKHVLFSESHKPTPVSPEPSKHSFFPEPQKHTAVSADIQEHAPFSEPQKPPHDLLKSPAVSPEILKHSTFTEVQKPSPESPEKQRQSFFAEPPKHSLSPEIQKPVSSDQKQLHGTDAHKPVESPGMDIHKMITDFSQPAGPVLSDLQAPSESSNKDLFPEHPEGSLLVPKEQSIQPKEPTEDVLYSCPKKKAKKENQEITNVDLNSSESGNIEMETAKVKEQESNSDQEQFDTESTDQNKETKNDAAGTHTQPQCVLQFTEEKEAFISEEEIAKYMKRGKGKYYCKICCCRAMKKGAVLHHLVNKHNVHSPYKCDVCGKAFLLESHLKNHVAAHSQSLLKCPRCNFESNFPRGFKKHLTHCQSRHNEEANKKQVEAAIEPLNQSRQSEEAIKTLGDDAEPSKELLNELQTE